ncbi:hypothetical protein MLD38_036088 [Melastoma candidum]|uniref:Uncharacterized protein n=1 Tax=Melastoma candidum TaxID=119954 RepID=A0ACB9LJT3_9MYRT|nr:hypothetical protein MLD38_036088 [Melastoma candidum]
MSYRDSVTVQVKGLEITFVRILSVFTSIDLSENGFWGPIPAEIGMLKSLKGLNLSHNGFTRNIPPSIGDLCSLEWLDLSANMLDGQRSRHAATAIAYCPKAHGGHGDVLLWWIAASIGYGPGLLLGISMGYIFLKTGRPTWLARFLYRMDAKVMKMSRRKAGSSQR